MNTQKDLAWKAVLNCLPTRQFLKKRGSSKTEICPVEGCNEIETTAHLFWECKTSKGVWELLAPWLGLFHTPLNKEQMFYGDIKTKQTEIKKRWWAAINCVKEALWVCRGVTAQRKMSILICQIANVALFKVKDYVLRDKLRREEDTDNLWFIAKVPKQLKNVL